MPHVAAPASARRIRPAAFWVFASFLLSTIYALHPTIMGAAAAPFNGKGKPAPYALIFGTVWGPNDHPVYGVRVKIRRANEKKARWEIYSDRNGEFAPKRL